MDLTHFIAKSPTREKNVYFTTSQYVTNPPYSSSLQYDDVLYPIYYPSDIINCYHCKCICT